MAFKPVGYSYQKWDYIDISDEYDDGNLLIGQSIGTESFDIAIDMRTNVITGQVIGAEQEKNSPRLAEVADKCRSFVSENLAGSTCVYCGSNMVAASQESEEVIDRSVINTNRLMFSQYVGSAAPTLDIHSEFEQRLHTCSYCTWWKLIILHDCAVYNNNSERGERRYGWNTGKKGLNEDIRHKIVAYGMMKQFEIGAADAHLDELRAWLANHPDHISHVDPFKFEDIIAQSLRDRGVYAEVRKIGGRGDRGIDILLVDQEGEPILVQVKRRQSGKIETVDSVRALNGVLLREGIPRGMIITTAGRFTKPAVNETNVHREGLFARYRVDLHSLDYVENLLRTTYQNEPAPWRNEPTDFNKLAPWLPREREQHGRPGRERMHARRVTAMLGPRISEEMASLSNLEPRGYGIRFNAYYRGNSRSVFASAENIKAARPSGRKGWPIIKIDFECVLPTFAIAAARAMARDPDGEDCLLLDASDFEHQSDRALYFWYRSREWDADRKAITFQAECEREKVAFLLTAKTLAQMLGYLDLIVSEKEACDAFDANKQALYCIAQAAYNQRGALGGNVELTIADVRS
jgi:hypothetical protein